MLTNLTSPHNPVFITEFMTITINGEMYSDLSDSMSVAELIAYLKLSPKKVGVERNREIVPKSTYSEVELKDGDQLEIIHFIGGG